MPNKQYSKEMLPTLAAVVLNYNYSQFVADAIESVLNQSVPFDDIIVVDDGSTDRSIEVIRSYLPRIQIIEKENGGQLSAAMAGIKKTSAEYVYLLDADDYATDGLVSVVKQQLADRPAKLQFQLLTVNAIRQAIGNKFPTYSTGYGQKEMLQDNRVVGFYVCPPTSGNVYKRSILASMNMSHLNLRDFVDGPPALAMPYFGTVKSINIPLAFYRTHSNSDSCWDRPDIELLEKEVNRFYNRWRDVCVLVGMTEPPFGDLKPLYVLERRLMQAALGGGRRVLRGAMAYFHRLMRACLPGRQKAMLAMWAVALLVPSLRWRRKLVLVRRSPLNRSVSFQRLIGHLTKTPESVASET